MSAFPDVSAARPERSMVHRSVPPFDPAELPPWRRVVAVVAALVAVGAGAWWLLRPAAPPVEAALPLASSTTSAAPAPGSDAVAPVTAPVGAGTGADLVVQAAGAVARPGVYRLDPGDRVDDLIDEAGGLAPDADGDRVNLAAPLADGERIWVPRRGEDQVPEVVAGGTGGSSGAGGDQAPGPAALVDLNTATAEELDTLPGIGPATASAILAHRDQSGPFGSVDDLLEVRGIGDAKLEQLRPLVRV